MFRIFIAGCGYVGNALGKRLAGDGHCVWGLRRHIEHISAPIQPMRADLTQLAELQGIPPRLDTIFYMAAANSSDDDAYREAYVLGMRYLIEALRRQNQRPRRFIFTSSTAVYGQTGGEWVDEESPTMPCDFAGRRLLEAEALLLNGPFPATVLRLAGIYGPGRARFIDQVKRGEADSTKDEGVFSNRIHRDDCVGALRHLMLLGAPESLYIGVDHEPAERGQVLRWIAEQVGVSKTWPPDDIASASFAPKRGADRSSGLKQTKLSATRRGRSNKRCRNDRLVRSGYLFRYPTFREGYAAILEGEK
jgi:nucleoside-diphosphate-sugar epimerase